MPILLPPARPSTPFERALPNEIESLPQKENPAAKEKIERLLCATQDPFRQASSTPIRSPVIFKPKITFLEEMPSPSLIQPSNPIEEQDLPILLPSEIPPSPFGGDKDGVQPLLPPQKLPPLRFSPEGILLHANQDVHRKNRANIAVFAASTIFPLRLKNPNKEKAYQSAAAARNELRNIAEKEADKLQNERAIIKKIRFILLDVAQRIAPFRFRIQKEENRKDLFFNVSLDFARYHHQTPDIKRIIKEIKRLDKYETIFSLKSCNVSEPTKIEMLLEGVLNQIGEDPRVPSITQQAVLAKGNAVFRHAITKNETKTVNAKWILSLDLRGTLLTEHEIQYLLWKILELEEYGELFAIGAIALSYTSINLQTFTNFAAPNPLYQEVQGDRIGECLHESLTNLQLDHWKIDKQMLTCFQEYQNLKALRLNFSIQKKSDLVKERDVRRVCPLLALLELKNPQYINSQPLYLNN